MSAVALTRLYLEIASRIDGASLVEHALRGRHLPPATHVLALGKVAAPMWEGLQRALPDFRGRALLVVPDGGSPSTNEAQVAISDHPRPTARSVQAAERVRTLIDALLPSDHLTVLLSGGASSLVATPADGLTLEDKCTTTEAVARAGASIHELNTVRKHLSAIKGGQLAAACRAPIALFALSDVVGNDPSTIGSGPFSPDPTTFAEALAIVDRLAPRAPRAARDRLVHGAAGDLPETPKPGDPRMSRVRYEIVAGPERLAKEAFAALTRAKLPSDTLALDTQATVDELALDYGRRARDELATGGPPRVLVGTGEPRIVVSGSGRGGRATHLALLVAKQLSGLRGVAFLAAGTDLYDGRAGASGAVVDGATWSRAAEAGHDPQAALESFSSAELLDALGCLIRGPGRSNLLDLHLLAVAPSGDASLPLPLFAAGGADD